MDEFLKNFKEDLNKEEGNEVHEGEVVKENELISISVDLVLKIDMIKREMDSTMKKVQEHSKLVEKQEEEFARKTWKMLMESAWGNFVWLER
ncbi:hypothetical protein Dsin_030054 [Dipteronia sinensis]|uniref:Uncharacterized protein n=1 Tax=Dipteronia sinensis TaxID=43782 RepID=A0AAD9ZI35_9ROSI|nr:hypothetical protein Dsin_030054 [Dipteronia sinensis]